MSTTEYHTAMMTRTASRWNRRFSLPTQHQVITGALVTLMVLAYFIPRIVALDRLVTVDEALWLARSANFYDAIMRGDLEETYQFAHPGVMTLWSGAIMYHVAFPEYVIGYPPQVKSGLVIHSVIRDHGRDPLAVLVAGRTIKLLMQTVFLALGFWLARPVFGTLTAAVGTLLLAFDPFLIAHDRLFHVDSMTALSSFVALLAFLRYITQQDHLRYLMASAVFAAIAWLNRTPGVLVAGVAGLTFFILAWHQYWQTRISLFQAVKHFARPAAIWSAAAVATTFVAWPALWVAPSMVARRIYAYSFNMAAEGHEKAIFFGGKIVQGDPGLIFYPVTLLWRLTPFTLIGIALLVLGLAIRSHTILPMRLRVPVALLVSFVVLYVAGMSFNAKKFDRYILPVYPAIDFIAAVGIVGASRLVARGQGYLKRLVAGAAITGAVLGQLLSTLGAAPYYLTYFNPLLGGTVAAEERLLLGWGEGNDQVATYILSQPGGSEARIRTSNNRVTILYFLPPTTFVSHEPFASGMEGMTNWAKTDYYVAYKSEWQRNMGGEVIDHIEALSSPVHTVSLEGAEFARIYDLHAIPPPSSLTDHHPCAFAFGDDVQLVAYDDERLHSANGTDHRRIRLYFTTLSNPASSYHVRLDLLPRGSNAEPVTRTAMLRPDVDVGMLSTVEYDVPFPDGHSIDDFFLTVTVLNTATNQPIVATQITTEVESQQAFLPICH